MENLDIINNYYSYFDSFINEINIIPTDNKRIIESKKKTIKAYKERLFVFINYLFDNKIDICSIDNYDVEKIFKYIQVNGYNKGKIKKIYSNESMKLMKVAVSKFFEYLKSEKIIDRSIKNPFNDRIKYLKKDYNQESKHIKDKLLTHDEINIILEYILSKNCRIRDKTKLCNAILLMLCFGLRISELTSLERSDFQIIDDKIRLNVKPSKRGKERTTYYIYKNKYYNQITNIIRFENFKFNIKTISKQIERIANKFNMQNFSSHSFRHTFATTYLTIGGTIETLSRLLGHDDIKTTQIYAKILDLRIENEIDMLKEVD